MEATSGVVRPLEEAAESLVAKIMEMEVIQASPPPDALPGQSEGVRGHGKYAPAG
jgi:hypothetical protein